MKNTQKRKQKTGSTEMKMPRKENNPKENKPQQAKK
jgi:hypothetical protein